MTIKHKLPVHHLIGNGDLHIYIRFYADASDLFHHFRRRVQVNHALMDSHLEPAKNIKKLNKIVILTIDFATKKSSKKIPHRLKVETEISTPNVKKFRTNQ